MAITVIPKVTDNSTCEIRGPFLKDEHKCNTRGSIYFSMNK